MRWAQIKSPACITLTPRVSARGQRTPLISTNGDTTYFQVGTGKAWSGWLLRWTVIREELGGPHRRHVSFNVDRRNDGVHVLQHRRLRIKTAPDIQVNKPSLALPPTTTTTTTTTPCSHDLLWIHELEATKPPSGTWTKFRTQTARDCQYDTTGPLGHPLCTFCGLSTLHPACSWLPTFQGISARKERWYENNHTRGKTNSQHKERNNQLKMNSLRTSASACLSRNAMRWSACALCAASETSLSNFVKPLFASATFLCPVWNTPASRPHTWVSDVHFSMSFCKQPATG